MIWRTIQLAAFAVGLHASVPQSFSLVTPGGNPADTARLLTSDSSGNLFLIYSSPRGISANNIHIVKTDPAGNTLASFDFGGSATDTPMAAATDPQGNLIVAGWTGSQDFPLVAPVLNSGQAFATKIDSQLGRILFSTRLGTIGGGPVLAGASAVAVDTSGNIYITGSTNDGFPTTAGSLQPQAPTLSQAGTIEHGFLMELNSSGGRVVFATYFSGSSFVCSNGSNPCFIFQPIANVSPPVIYTTPSAIAVDSTGAITIAGITNSSNLAVSSQGFSTQCNCTNLNSVAFIARIAPGGGKLVWGTYLPLTSAPSLYAPSIVGVPTDTINAIALDSAGNVVFTGVAAAGFPISASALQSTFPPVAPGSGVIYAAYVAKLDSSESKLVFSTWFGSAGAEANGSAPVSLALDSAGDIWITGTAFLTSSLPAPAGTQFLGNNYIAGLTPDGTSVVSLTLVPNGGSGVAIQATSAGTVDTIGSSGALLISSGSAGPSLLGIAGSPSFTTAGAVVPRELITLYGIGLGPSTGVTSTVTSGVLSNSLGGVQVLFDGVPAALLYAGPTQINTIVPAATAGRLTTNISVITPSGKIAGPTLPVVATMPQVFSSATGFALAVNQDGSLNSFSNPAAAGSVVSIWLTGGGAQTYTPDNQINSSLAGNPYPVSVLAANPRTSQAEPTSLEIRYAGDAPGLPSGIIQVNFVLPSWAGISYEIQIGNASASFTLFALAAPGS
ncbi:MAG TPA: SBBP repeat-containing protein [Verrucomicrobiae bacterium]|nr:SBBP repeat-containing protein [Verrucomicrobiae bacterium]